MIHRPLTLSVLPGRYSVCRLGPKVFVPDWATQGDFVAATRVGGEVTIVCADEAVPAGVPAERGWACLGVEGSFEFSVIGVMADVASALAASGVPLLAFSSFSTDYILVRESDLDPAIEALRGAGHEVGS